VAADAHACAWETESETTVAGDRTKQVDRSGSADTRPLVEQHWPKIERSREKLLENSSAWLFARLRRRAFLVVKALPVLPGQSVLELGAGSGIWTEHFADVLAGQSPLTAVVFNKDLARKAHSRNLPDTRFVYTEDFQSAFPPGSFDYVVGTDILTDELCPATLEIVYRLLKPGGQFVFFTRNVANPLSLFREALKTFQIKSQSDDLQLGVSAKTWRKAAVRLGFENIEAIPAEVIPPLYSSAGHAIGLILERAPVARRFSSIISMRSIKPGCALNKDSPPVSLATHRQLFGTVSVVVPCHDEAVNIKRLVSTLVGMYGDYLHEIVIVDDNSTDGTAQVATAVANTEPRVKLVERKPPGGVGRALRDGYAAASGKYILTIDCDFVTIASEFRGLFDAVAEGYDGAIGSRFSSESALVRYPFFKILCNRGYHLLLNLLLGKRVRDISNNLKLYRAEILKNLKIEEDHFAANVETGLKPLLLNYRIREVPTSWINRTADMGKSSFNLLKVGPDYLTVLFRTAWRYWRGQFHVSR
jgi:dolichol-phosphate mannosyltransferase